MTINKISSNNVQQAAQVQMPTPKENNAAQNPTNIQKLA